MLAPVLMDRLACDSNTCKYILCASNEVKDEEKLEAWFKIVSHERHVTNLYSTNSLPL